MRRAINLLTTPAGAEGARIAVIENFLIDIREGGEVGIHAIVHEDAGRVVLGAEAVGPGGGPFEVHSSFTVATGGSSVDVNQKVVPGQVRVLVVEALEVAPLLGSCRGNGDGRLGWRATRVTQRIAAVAQMIERVEVVGVRIVYIGRIVGAAGDVRNRSFVRQGGGLRGRVAASTFAHRGHLPL